MKEKLKALWQSLRSLISGRLLPVLFPRKLREVIGKAVAPVAAKLGENRYLRQAGDFTRDIVGGLFSAGRRGIYYLILFIAAFLFFTLVNMDTSGLTAKLEAEVYNRTGLRLTVTDMGLSFPPGVSLKGITLRDPRQGVEAELDRVTVRPLFLPLFTGNVSVRVNLYRGSGILGADVGGLAGDDLRLSVDGKDFPVHQAVRKVMGQPLPVKGLLSATGNLTLEGRNLRKGNGTVNLSITRMKLVDNQLTGGLLSKLSPDSAACTVKLEKARLTTDACKAATPMGEAELKLSTTVAARPEHTPLSGFIIIKNPKDLLQSFLAIYPQHQRPDGAYHIPLRGTFARPMVGL